MNPNTGSSPSLIQSARAMIGMKSPSVSPIAEAKGMSNLNKDWDAELGADYCDNSDEDEDLEPPTVSDIISQLDTMIDLDLEQDELDRSKVTDQDIIKLSSEL